MKPLRQAFQRLSLNRKLASLLLAVFLVSLIVLLSALNILFGQYAAKQVENRAVHLMDAMSAVRQYTDEYIDPIISPLNQKSKTFHPESIPTFSSQRVFALMKINNSEYAAYSYREAALDPTNPRDKADPQEAKFIRIFRANPSLTVLKGISHASAELFTTFQSQSA